MWKELQGAFFLFFQKKCRYHIFITDYIKIWEAYYTEEQFIKCLKDSNFCLEIDTYELIKRGTEMLINPKEFRSVDITHNQTSLTVSMTKLFGYPLHLKINLKEGPCELFFQKITQPLLKIVKDLRCSEQELRKTLLMKDEEIEEYKSLGSKIRYTALPPYSDEVHMQKHSTYENNLGNMTIPDFILDKTVNLSRENAMEVDIDSNKIIKQEPASQETMTSNEQTTNAVIQIKEETTKTELKPTIPIRTKRKKTLNL